MRGSLQEALRLGHNHVGAEHLLLALLREGDGVAVQVLADLGAGYAQVRERVLGLLAEAGEQTDPSTRLVRLAVPADLAEAVERLGQVRRQREAASDAGDLEGAAALRDREEQLGANADASATTGLRISYQDSHSGGVLLLGVDGAVYEVSYGSGRLRLAVRAQIAVPTRPGRSWFRGYSCHGWRR